MLKIINNLSKLKNYDLIINIENKKDIKKLEFLNLNENILFDLEKKFEDEKQNDKSFKQKYFLWEKNIKNLFVYFYDKKNNNKTYEEFLWDFFRETWEKIVILEEKNIEEIFEIAILSKYKFDYYLKEKQNLKIKILSFSKNEEILKEKLEKKLELVNNIISSRNLVNLSTPEKTPEKIVKYIKSLKLKNTKVKVLDHKKIKKLWLNLIDNVWKASENKPYLVILERIVDKKAPYYGFVWKWIVFDTWWLNIKVGKYMKTMKLDMAWSSTVIHTLKQLDNKKDLKVNIIWAVALAENAISENSYRPDDIIKAYNWKTVEIINTDAEGRLVLADAMSYISKKYELDSIISIATLTWACMVALGYNYAWIMWNNDKIIEKIIKNNSYEKYNRLPFDNYLKEKTKWEISDLKNLSEQVLAWASMWAAFLSNFCDKNEKYIHIDIAWVSYREDDFWVFTKQATWFWVKSLSEVFLNLN